MSSKKNIQQPTEIETLLYEELISELKKRMKISDELIALQQEHIKLLKLLKNEK